MPVRGGVMGMTAHMQGNYTMSLVSKPILTKGAINLYFSIDKEEMSDELAQEAITAALSGEWKKAVELNSKLLTSNSEDTNALNRLARAFCELGDMKKAREAARKVVKIDPLNTIATKSLEKWRDVKKNGIASPTPTTAYAFLEEPGRTKIVPLLHLGDSQVLASIDCGDEVLFVPHTHRLSVTTTDGKYIGRLTDDLANHLIKLIKMGNTYQVLLKSVSKQDVKVFVRELTRSPKLANVFSFSPEKIDFEGASELA